MANFSDLVRTQRQSGAGVGKSLASAAAQQILEKVDIRNYLFSRKGTMTALFPGLKGYQAGGKSKTDKIASQGSSGLATEQISQLTDSIDRLGAQISIVAKNSYSLPMMSRDMNVMRQNIVKLVKISGGTPSTRADMFFMKAKDREASYESQFGRRSTSPTSVNAPQAQKEGFFAGLLKGGFAALLPLLVKAGLVAGLAAAIKEYINNPEFRETINKGVKAVFDTILEFMKEHWKETLIALALLFPRTTLAIIGEGLSLLAKVLGATARGGGLITLFRGIIGVLSGPVGVIALLGLMAYGLSEWIENNTEWGKKAKENRLAQPKDLTTIENPDDKIDLRKPSKAVKDMTFDEAETESERRAVSRANDLFIKGGMVIRDAKGNLTDEYKKVLFTYRKEARQEINKERAGQPPLQIQGLKRKGASPSAQATENSPVPVPEEMDGHDHASNRETSPVRTSTNKEMLPVNGSISSPFGQRASGMHNGTDFAVKIGTPVVAPQDGVVANTGEDNINGKFVVIKSGDALHSLLHLSKIGVEKGQTIKIGEKIGESGNTGRSTGPHLHWSKRVAGNAIDPMLAFNTADSPVLASAKPSMNGKVIAENSVAAASSKNGTDNNSTVNNVVTNNNQTIAQSSAAIPASAYDTDLIKYLLRPVT